LWLLISRGWQDSTPHPPESNSGCVTVSRKTKKPAQTDRFLISVGVAGFNLTPSRIQFGMRYRFAKNKKTCPNGQVYNLSRGGRIQPHTLPNPIRDALPFHVKQKRLQFLEAFVFLCRGGRIRTYDPLLPKQMRYRAALHPVKNEVQRYKICLLCKRYF
jgi:hypothetical protein